MYPLLRRALFRMDPERAHDLTLALLDRLPGRRPPGWLGAARAGAPVQVMGLSFPNAVGLAAGLDKNADHIDALGRLGFGFIEVGTVTPRPQPGNPRPRLFRIPERQALVNRFGFNNKGVEHLVEQVRRARYAGVIGINIGKNRDTPVERAVDDYLFCLRRVHAHAHYVTVNVSSPNTPGLRNLQQGGMLGELLGALAAERERLATAEGRRVPLVLKVAPDLEPAEIDTVAQQVLAHGIDGVAATNTTLARDGVKGLTHAEEAGGLSGAPLRERATEVLGAFAARLEGRAALIGVGGVLSADDAAEKARAGADLVQLYTGLIYRGPALVAEAAHRLAAEPPPSRRPPA